MEKGGLNCGNSTHERLHQKFKSPFPSLGDDNQILASLWDSLIGKKKKACETLHFFTSSTNSLLVPKVYNFFYFLYIILKYLKLWY